MMDMPIADPERLLMVTHTPAAVRPAMALLWRLDERLEHVTLGAQPAIAAIKLAWWREALLALDTRPAPAEPLLREIADGLLPRGISGAELAEVAAGWDALIEGDEDEAGMLARHADLRGGGLFRHAATLLGSADGADIRGEGALWALAALPPPFAGPAAGIARERLVGAAALRWPRALRPLGMLALLARDRIARPDDAGSTSRRLARALWYRISGR